MLKNIASITANTLCVTYRASLMRGWFKMTDSMWISTPAMHRSRAFETGYGN